MGIHPFVLIFFLFTHVLFPFTPAQINTGSDIAKFG